MTMNAYVGIPSLGVPALEPLLVSSIDIGAGAGPVVIMQNYRRIKLHGLTDSVLTTYKLVDTQWSLICT